MNVSFSANQNINLSSISHSLSKFYEQELLGGGEHEVLCGQVT